MTQPQLGSVPSKNTIKRLVQYLGQDEVSQIQGFVEDTKALMACYRCALLEVETKFRVLNEQFSLQHARNPIDSIKTRVKTPESIVGKLDRKGLPHTLEAIETQLFDIAGLRVICPFVDDIYILADCILQQDDVRLVERKDYIANPKPNGYRSLHLIIEVPIFLRNEKRFMKVEVQLRTIAMELWANLEHKLRYKKNLDEETAALVAGELTSCSEMTALVDRKMQYVRNVIDNEH